MSFPDDCLEVVVEESSTCSGERKEELEAWANRAGVAVRRVLILGWLGEVGPVEELS
jgi:hypothetical protein